MTSAKPDSAEDLPSASQWIAQCRHIENRQGYRIAYRRRGTGPVIVLLHGFPTWSYDYAGLAVHLAQDHDVITMDFLGYGASDKPKNEAYSVASSADTVEDLLAHLKITSVSLVVHDYGGIVGQELLDRQSSQKCSFTITSLTILNSGIVYSAYRPTFMQKLLILPVIGKLLASQITAAKTRTLLGGVMGKQKLSDDEFAELWHGIALNDGHKLSYLHIRYNNERGQHHQRWEKALADWDGPLHLVWGLDDPVSGRHVLELAQERYLRARVTALEGIGHYPQVEAAQAVIAAIREVDIAQKPRL